MYIKWITKKSVTLCTIQKIELRCVWHTNIHLHKAHTCYTIMYSNKKITLLFQTVFVCLGFLFSSSSLNHYYHSLTQIHTYVSYSFLLLIWLYLVVHLIFLICLFAVFFSVNLTYHKVTLIDDVSNKYKNKTYKTIPSLFYSPSLLLFEKIKCFFFLRSFTSICAARAYTFICFFFIY